MYVNAFNRFTKEARRLEKRLCDVFANRSRGPRTEASRMNEKKKKKGKKYGNIKIYSTFVPIFARYRVGNRGFLSGKGNLSGFNFQGIGVEFHFRLNV